MTARLDPNPLLAVVSGLPGSGKSSFASALASDLNLLFLELDLWRAPAIRHHGLLLPWLHLRWLGNPLPLVSALSRRAGLVSSQGVILTLPSHHWLRLPLLGRLERAGIHPFITHAPPECCLRSFLERERLSARHLGASHWRKYSRSMLRRYAESGYERYWLATFRADGTRRPMADILSEACERLAAAPLEA